MKVIRIVRTPAIEAGLARFDAWWGARSPRERTMLAGLAIFLGALVLVFGVIRPLQAARAQALADIRTYETLNARIRAAGTLRTTPARPQRGGTPAEMVSGSAAGFGLVVSPEPIPGGVRVTIADASYDSLMGWIADVGATTRLAVKRVTIQRRPGPGRVSATVDFGA